MNKRLISYLLAAIMLASIFFRNGFIVFAEEEDTEIVPPQVSLSVEYSKPEADGRLDAWLTVSCDQGDGEDAPDTAEDVEVIVQAHELIEFLDVTGPYEIAPLPDNKYKIKLHDMKSGSTRMCTLRIKIRGMDEIRRDNPLLDALIGTYENNHIHLDEEGGIIVPWLKLKVTSKNYGSCEYSCDLDIAPEPRAVILGWNNGSDPSIENDTGIMNDTWSQCYFNGLPVDVVISSYNEDWKDIREQIGDLETDDNDLTYFYVNAHGLENLRAHIAGNNSDYSYDDDARDIHEEGTLIPYEDLVSVFSGVRGRAVIVFDSCFSGFAVNAAEQILDPERMVILSSVNTKMYSGAYPNIGWFTNDLGILAGKSDSGFLGFAVDLLKHQILPFPTLNEMDVEIYRMDGVVSVQEAKACETLRHSEIAVNKIIGFLPLCFTPMSTDDKVELLYTGIDPQTFGDATLPLFELTKYTDDYQVIIAVKNEEYQEYPPSSRAEVVFSYDAEHVWAGTVTMYVLNEDGHLVSEASEDPSKWTFRTMLTDDNYGYRPAPISQTGGISTRLFAVQLSDSLVLTEWDTGLVAAGPNPPAELSTYSIWHVDPHQGIELVLKGEYFAEYNIASYQGDLIPEKIRHRLDGSACSEEEFRSAFKEYGVDFSDSMIDVTEIMREAFLMAACEEGEVVLEELRSSIGSELPPAYVELEAVYGLAEP